MWLTLVQDFLGIISQPNDYRSGLCARSFCLYQAPYLNLDLLCRAQILTHLTIPQTPLGHPATKDVGTLSDMLSSIRDHVEGQVGAKLGRVVVSTAQFPALTEEDLQDALEYIGLRSWLDRDLPHSKMLHAPNAAYAASGRKLCKD